MEIVNAMLARAKALPQLQRHDHWDWHLHAVDPDRPEDIWKALDRGEDPTT